MSARKPVHDATAIAHEPARVCGWQYEHCHGLSPVPDLCLSVAARLLHAGQVEKSISRKAAAVVVSVLERCVRTNISIMSLEKRRSSRSALGLAAGFSGFSLRVGGKERGAGR